MYDEDWKTTSASPDTMLQTCRAEGVLFLVIVKSKHSQTVRVKSVLLRTETDGANCLCTCNSPALTRRAVDLIDLAGWLDTALVEHRKGHGTGQVSGPASRAQARPTEPAASSARESVEVAADHRPSLIFFCSIQILLPGDATRKLKHRSRQMTLDRGECFRPLAQRKSAKC